MYINYVVDFVFVFIVAVASVELCTINLCYYCRILKYRTYFVIIVNCVHTKPVLLLSLL